MKIGVYSGYTYVYCCVLFISYKKHEPFGNRLALFALFWIMWVGMLAASVIIIIYAPKCPSPEPKTWWQKGPIYKVTLEYLLRGSNLLHDFSAFCIIENDHIFEIIEC